MNNNQSALAAARAHQQNLTSATFRNLQLVQRRALLNRNNALHNRRTGSGFQGNLVNGNIDGRRPWRRGIFGRYHRVGGNRAGYVLDTNRNGRYDRGRDGVLAFDMNGDGRITRKDVNNTNNLMKAATGNFDLNNDGRVTRFERARGHSLRRTYARLDRNRDGRLSSHEINNAGGRVWIDRSRGGGVGRNELHSVFNLPNSRGYGPSQRLNSVNPFSRTSHTSNNYGGGSDFYGRGWGCGCQHHGGYNSGRMYAGGTPGFNFGGYSGY